jgi:acylphosphatase
MSGHGRLLLRISGRVQGVSYRANAARRAVALGLLGWVRNVPSGDVELVAEGPASALDELQSWARRGPPLAHVESVDAQRTEATGEFSDFAIR